MRSFDSLGAFAEHLLIVQGAIKIALHNAVKDSTALIAKTAREEIGVYQHEVGTAQDDIGVFPAWAPLADSTEKEKERLGYALDAPLLRDGEFRDSIKDEAIGLKGVVGTKDERGLWFEVGTDKMPPRPVFGPAAVRNEERVLRNVFEAAASALIGGDWMHAPIGGPKSES